MPGDMLTYRSSGIDINVNNEANQRIQAHIRGTYTHNVITKAGLFGGGVSLGEYRRYGKPVLFGSLGSHPGVDSETKNRNGEQKSPFIDEIVKKCIGELPPAAEPIAFLDYIASAHLDPLRVEGFVRRFADHFSRVPQIPIIGGETAEMPGVFRKGAWEIVGALYGLADAGSRDPVAVKQAESVSCIDISLIKKYSNPTLVFSMDGIGTKTKLGLILRKTDGLACDIIHHSLNDILCQGAEGVAMLLYIGCHTREEDLIQPMIGAAAECERKGGVKLLDLVVVEKREIYLSGEYDICAAVAGIVDADRLIQGMRIRAGDLLVGLPSSGLHTNGYSLARKALLEKGGLKLDQWVEDLKRTLGEELLTPHRNYGPTLLPLLQDSNLRTAVKGIAHITGGGLKDNLKRILPEGLGADIHLSSWEPQPIFHLIQKLGNVPLHDPMHKGMYETFNMGIGMVIVVDSGRTDEIMNQIRLNGEKAVFIGNVVPRTTTEGRERIRLLP